MAQLEMVMAATETEIAPLNSENEDLSQESSESIDAAGSLWKRFKPENKDSLFYKIIKYNDPAIVAEEWINTYTVDQENMLAELLQLFVDLSGYQYINVKNFLMYNEIEEVVTHMEGTQNSLHQITAKYFFAMRSKFYKDKQKKIDKFIAVLVDICGKHKVLFDHYFTKRTILFLQLMALSLKRCIRHTGIHLALKLQTGFLTATVTIMDKIREYSANLEVQTDEVVMDGLERKKQRFLNYFNQINDMINFLQRNIFKINWNLLEPRLGVLREEWCLETGKWVFILPARTTYLLEYVIWCIKDPLVSVRFTAMEVIGRVLDKFHDNEVLQSWKDKCIMAIYDRLRDVNYRLSVYTVDQFIILNRHKDLVPHYIRDAIFVRIYCFYYPLAAAAGRFLIEAFERKCNTGKELLLKLITFQKVSEFDKKIEDRHPLLVEAVFDCCTVIKDVSLYIQILEEELLEKINRAILLDILTEVVHITFSGSCTKQRQAARKAEVNKEEADKMLSDLLNVLPALCRTYSINNLKSLVSELHKYKQKAALTNGK